MKLKSLTYLAVGTFTFALTLGTSGCSEKGLKLTSTPRGAASVATQLPLLAHARITVLNSEMPSIAPAASSSTSVGVEITVNTEALLKQEFLYGADLQYSSHFDTDMELYQQSLAVGHIPSRFRISGNELQLVADQRRLYPGDINHPEQVLSRYKILQKTDTTLTISGANSGPTLNQIFTSKIKAPQDLWIRSFQYIQDGNYLLQETSVVLENGVIAEFMESVFPRATLNPGPSFEKFAMDPTDLIGGTSGPVARFRMIHSEATYNGEEAVSYAQHYDISPKADGTPGTIDFYVTPNIPEEYLAAVKIGVEGWNRYFKKMAGIERKVVRFLGRLPDGIRLGDPRYNVINWDNRLVAGAAYESQASDPNTGVQSHSLIYMPAAWVVIGQNYWNGGQYRDSTPAIRDSFFSSENRKGIFRSSRLSCVRDLSTHSDLVFSGRLGPKEIEEFGIRTITLVLFHEVGHALGLDHNFEASLSYDKKNSNSEKTPVYSNSVMDYNDLEIERQAFLSTTSEEGPLLEYDRQILSALYNHSKDIRESDPILPACNDGEADQKKGGVNPLCNRYDLENDPTLSVVTAFERVTQAKMENDVTLAQALERVGIIYSHAELIESIKTEAELKVWLQEINAAVDGALHYYFVTGVASVARTVRTNIKSLLVFQKGILPATYNESEMRSRAYWGLNMTFLLQSLPTPVEQAIAQIQQKLGEAALQTPYLQSLQGDTKNRIIEILKASIQETAKGFESNPKRGLTLTRATISASLKRSPEVPFFLGKVNATQVDFEIAVVTLLANVSMNPTRSGTERIAAAGSLATYQGRTRLGDEFILVAIDCLKKERDTAETNDARETSSEILKKLSGT